MTASKEPKAMKPIWYFVGLVLLSMGALILLSGLYGLVRGVRHETVLASLRPDIWWGAVMLVAGAVFYLRNR